MNIDINDPKNYKFELSNDTLHLSGAFIDNMCVASKENPMVHITTNNIEDRILIIHLPRVKGAKKLVDEERPNYDTDPYGRRVQRGTRPYQVWDLSEIFK